MPAHRLYPWEEWFGLADGSKQVIKTTRTLKYGRDYHCPTYVMAQQIRNEARRRKVRVSIKIRTNSLILRVRGKR